jgi:small subunit ribosomal protein S17
MSAETKNKRRTLQGIVTSDRMDKTITVRVERLFKHPKYKKYIRRHKKYLVHDGEGQAEVGDIVDLVECRPLSKSKRWRLGSVVRKAKTAGGVK